MKEALENMTATQALRVAKDLSGLTNEEIAEQLGVKGVGSYFSDTTKDYPSFPLLAKFCAILRSSIPIEWLDAQYELHLKELHGERAKPEDVGDRPGVSLVMDNLMKAMTECTASVALMRELTNAKLEITESDAKTVDTTIMKAMRSLTVASQELRGTAVSAQYRDYDKPLFRNPTLEYRGEPKAWLPKRPWWKRIFRR